jgi:hypothetical protein
MCAINFEGEIIIIIIIIIMEPISSLEQYSVPIFYSVNPFREVLEQEKEKQERMAKNHLLRHALYDKAHLFGEMSDDTR